ncbi:Na+/H+ antiporter subunit G [Corynebacterium breve]|uniref:Na+/H+ antiporter subunit G n=1 Tax=Corynebacterium breve TaxID=3049799 RepID=A0ABY8VE40_9CORY|nr:Na+/H+ antiporter subunit G [Corynebacterium breve]WIM67921.1 Na+/H+ antiporter subunit G [Corynebacterium breve]
MTPVEIAVSILVIIGTFLTVATAVLMFRGPDALTRVNLLGPLTCVAMPLFIIAKLVLDWSVDGFVLHLFLRAIIAIIAVWIISAVGSFVMGRSIYGVTVVDRKHGIED